jgi:hypothetical protein
VAAKATPHINKARRTERDFPNIVEREIPTKGLDLGVSRDILTFHQLREIPQRFGRWRNRDNQAYCRYCFSDPRDADAFREQFGGVRLGRNTSRGKSPLKKATPEKVV